MIVQSYCPADPRVRREAETLADEGFGVDVLCLRNAGQSWVETVGGVRYLRLPIRRRRGGFLRYSFEYGMLTLFGIVLAAALHPFRRYRLFQAHNMPDHLVFCGIFPWFAGVPALLDMHDPIPEVYMSKYEIESKDRLIRFLTRVEGVSMGFADHVLAATSAFRHRLIERGRRAERITVVWNSADPRLFRSVPRGEPSATTTLLFNGTVTHRSGVDSVIHAVERVRARGRNVALVILGDGDYAREVRRLREDGDRASWLTLRGHVPLEEVSQEMGKADLGVIPNRANVFNDLALPTRLFEFLQVGVPVIVSHSRAIEELFAGVELDYFDARDEDDLARCIERAVDAPERGRVAVEAGRVVVERHSWERQRSVYLGVVESLIARSAATNER
jgi:glycosyltransferase involved in cell wall biosynthesis